MICPLMSRQYNYDLVYCKGDECAWYDEKREQCCIKGLGLAAARSTDCNIQSTINLPTVSVDAITGEVYI